MCKELYPKNETFWEHIHSSSLPAFAVVERIYYIGVEVNRFQKEELAQYGWLFDGWTIFNYSPSTFLQHPQSVPPKHPK